MNTAHSDYKKYPPSILDAQRRLLALPRQLRKKRAALQAKEGRQQ